MQKQNGPRNPHPETDWKNLAQCEGQIVRQFVEYGCRPAQVANRLQRERVFQTINSEESYLMNAINSYTVVKTRYRVKQL